MTDHMKEESIMTDWAKRELDLAGYGEDQEEGPNTWLRENVLELLEVFSGQGHSGSSAPFAIELFYNLARWKPLTPLTGEDDEWIEVGDGVFQNRRASSVFKENGQARWIDGIVFWEWFQDEETGEQFKSYFTSRDSSVPISFPFAMPDKPEYREAAR